MNITILDNTGRKSVPSTRFFFIVSSCLHGSLINGVALQSSVLWVFEHIKYSQQLSH
jgi:hypothetical protein